ncbi:hypothetical protein [Phytohabitans suffuscus]|uniref:Uncharacterized protein n=1 Tax=Phytohabitans suffuscus TaxID=624315 RepID=A0A6F8Z0Y6_9ACTN|nr:hypothetical protein [Phytohabitans suffuscus]BCB92095.1 hypothetical protein Psuf_094080 [Phytohabitans suffuscus]
MADESEGSTGGGFPLSMWERIIATVAGGVLLTLGALAVFVSANQAGSAALLLVGAVFVLFGVNGTPLLSGKLMEFEFQMAARLRRAVRDVAARLPDDEARLVLSTIEEASPKKYAEPLVALIDVLLFEARVRDAAMLTGERVVPRANPGTGEPLLDVVLSGDVRVGVFAMFAPSEHGLLTPEFNEAFLARLPAAGVQGVLLVTCVPGVADLDRLAERVPVPAVVVHSGPAGQLPPLGPFLDRLRSPVPRQPGPDPYR